MNDELTDNRIKISVTTLANAVELVAHTITNIAGNDISNSINNNKITMQAIRALATARFHRLLENKPC